MNEQTDGWPTHLTADEIAAIRSILARTKELIPTPARWTRLAYARDSRGKGVSPLAPNVARFCVTGAILAATYQLFVLGRDQGAPVEGVPGMKPPTEKSMRFIGFAIALISFERQVTRLEPTRVGFLNPEDGDGSGWVYGDYAKVPATVNDAPTIKHRDILELLDETRLVLGQIERLMEHAKTLNSVGERANTTLR